MSTANANELKNITVLGAGVIGLTTALKIQEQEGFQVTIVAEHLPTDPKTVKYASIWAGAHHVSVAGNDPAQREIDLETFRTMWDLSASDGPAQGCFMRLPQFEHYRHPNPNLDTLSHMPNFEEIPPENLAPGALSGITYDSVNSDTPTLLPYLLSRFRAAGGKIVRGSVQHIDQVINGGPGVFANRPALSSTLYPKPDYPLPDAVVVCVGLGARFLGGVEDKKVYPVRGQTVLIKAPWLKKCISLSGGDEGDDVIWTYAIPRRSGDIVLGGTYEADDWHPRPRAETTRNILERVLELCPEIAPPEIRAEREPTVEDILPIIVEEGCGFRPCRKDGPRLEIEWIKTKARKVPVVHNYGHGGFGYIASFGSASVALKLLVEALAQ